MLGIPLSAPGGDLSKWFIPTYVGHTMYKLPKYMVQPVHPHIRGAYEWLDNGNFCADGSSPHTWGIPVPVSSWRTSNRFIPTYVGHTASQELGHRDMRFIPTYVGHTPKSLFFGRICTVHPHIRGAYRAAAQKLKLKIGSSPHTWGIHWTAVRKMAGFSHFSYDFIRKSYFVQGLVFFGVIGAEASPTHRRGRNQCLPGAHGGSVRNL